MKVIQTKKAKEEFYSPLFDFLKETKTKEEIAKYLGVSERTARDEVALISKHYAVIRGSFQKGYRLAKPIKNLNSEELNQEMELIQKTINEFKSRIKDMKQTMKPLIAYLKVAEKEKSSPTKTTSN